MIPCWAASDGIRIIAKESKQTRKRHQTDVAYLDANMVMNINKTVPKSKRNIQNEDLLMELWQQGECRLMQDLSQQG